MAGQCQERSGQSTGREDAPGQQEEERRRQRTCVRPCTCRYTVALNRNSSIQGVKRLLSMLDVLNS